MQGNLITYLFTPCAFAFLDTSLRRYDAFNGLIAMFADSSCSPPIVVRRVDHMQDITVIEGQTAMRQAAVATRVVVE